MNAQEKMNAEYHRIISGLLLNAEQDVLLAKAEGDTHATAKAQARFETLKATLGVYAYAHQTAHGRRPWAREQA